MSLPRRKLLLLVISLITLPLYSFGVECNGAVLALGLTFAGGLASYAAASSRRDFQNGADYNSGEVNTTVTEAPSDVKTEDTVPFLVNGSEDLEGIEKQGSPGLHYSDGLGTSQAYVTGVQERRNPKWYKRPEAVASFVALLTALLLLSQRNVKETWKDILGHWLTKEGKEGVGSSDISALELEEGDDESPVELPSERELYLARTSYLLSPSSPERLVVFALEEAAATTLSCIYEVLDWFDEAEWETRYEYRAGAGHPVVTEKLVKLVQRGRHNVTRFVAAALKDFQRAALLMTEVPELEKFKRPAMQAEAKRNIQDAQKIMVRLQKRRDELRVFLKKFRLEVADIDKLIGEIGKESDMLMSLAIAMQRPFPVYLRKEVSESDSSYLLQEQALLRDLQQVVNSQSRCLNLVNMEEYMRNALECQTKYCDFLKSVRSGILPNTSDMDHFLTLKQRVVTGGHALYEQLTALFQDASDGKAALSVLVSAPGSRWGATPRSPVDRLLRSLTVSLKKARKAFSKLNEKPSDMS